MSDTLKFPFQLLQKSGSYVSFYVLLFSLVLDAPPVLVIFVQNVAVLTAEVLSD
jgi:hypothetical protein